MRRRFNRTTTLLLALIPLVFVTPGSFEAQEKEWHSHARVVKNIIEKFKTFESYTANFKIQTRDGKKVSNLSGKLYYQKPNRIRYEFSKPGGNLMVSDGKTLWVYIRSINAVGKQDLKLKKKDENGRQIFSAAPGPGLVRLFRKYHYRFDKPEQPRQIDNRKQFVLDLEQREKIGGYEKMLLYVDAESYLIVKSVATDDYGKVSTITFSDIKLDVPLDGTLFQYKPGRNVRVVNNPLVTE